jgi:hypothetical protein
MEGPPGPSGDPGPYKPVRLLDERVTGWDPANRQKLNQLLVNRGASSPTYDPARRPVVVFDWDNTVVKNDIGDATFFWMINNDIIRQPKDKDWANTNAFLTAAAKQALNAGCDALADEGQPLPTRTAPACADAIFHIYNNGKTPPSAGAQPAWTNEVTSRINQPYAWVAQLQAGYSPLQAREMARAAWERFGYAPIDTPYQVGTNTVTGWIRVYPQMRDLVGAFRDNGFDVWVLTASSGRPCPSGDRSSWRATPTPTSRCSRMRWT